MIEVCGVTLRYSYGRYEVFYKGEVVASTPVLSFALECFTEYTEKAYDETE